MIFSKDHLHLYAVTDHKVSQANSHYKSLEAQIDAAIQGGVSCVQFREKALKGEALQNLALKVKSVCEYHHVPFIINDNVELALHVHADGLHIGQSDGNVQDIKQKLPKTMALGVSAHHCKEALSAERDGADYLGVGAIFETASKQDATVVTITELKAICQAVKIPVVAIGGIQLENITALKDTGIDGVAVISALFASPDIKATARNLTQAISHLH